MSEETEFQDEWSQPTEKFVAFFDVMGFKDFVYSHSHDEVKGRIESLSNFCSLINSDFKPDENLPPFNKYLKIILISDSIIISTKGDTLDDICSLLTATGALVSGSLGWGIPIKGAISYGIFTFDSKKSIYVGKPLINASLIESSLEYYGCVIDHCVEKKINSSKWEHLYQELPEVKIPTKEGNINYHICTITILNSTKEEALRKFYSTVSGRARRYVDNSIDVYNRINKTKE